jgi:Flp pilus assembly protein TadB
VTTPRTWWNQRQRTEDVEEEAEDRERSDIERDRRRRKPEIKKRRQRERRPEKGTKQRQEEKVTLTGRPSITVITSSSAVLGKLLFPSVHFNYMLL